MSEVNLSFVVQTYDASFTVSTNELQFNPETTELGIYTGGYATAAGSSGQVQYNNSGILAGNSNFTYDVANSKLNVTQANTTNLTTTTANTTTLNITGVSNLNSISNVHVTGGTNGQYIKTDGTGNLSFDTISFPAGGSNTQLQYNNNGSFAGISSVVWNGSNLTIGNVANVKLLGGTNGQYLQTDGTGNISWVAGGGSGNGTVGGSNTQVQYNNAGSFGGDSGFTYNDVTNTLTVDNISGNLTGNITATGNATFQANIFAQGPLVLQFGKELTTLNSSPATGTITMYVLNTSIYYKTASASGNYTLNVTANSTTTLNTSMNIGETVTCTFINTNGFPGYYLTQLQIDGANVTAKWIGSAPSSGTSNSNDVYSFNIIKTASATFTVLATRGVFL